MTADPGWRKFAYEPQLAAWAAHALQLAIPLTQDPRYFEEWLRCDGTWFVGVNLLPNNAEGRVPNGPPLQGAAVDYLHQMGLMAPLDRAQLSVIYSGYPRPSPAESDAAFRFRRDRDAAHVDGLLPIGPDKRRHLHEPHGFVLGLPLNDADASPMVVWEGSHAIMREAFAQRLRGIDPADWPNEDLTDIYQTARRTCFEKCKRKKIRALPGEAYVIDRMALHGVAPWQEGDTAPSEGRIIAYFRPELAEISDWLKP